MCDPHLRRAVWLTTGQRRRLRIAVDEVLASPGEHDLLPSLLGELILEETGNHRLERIRIARVFVRGLRLPAGTFPVHVCDAQIDELVQRGVLDAELTRVLRPGKPPRSDAKDGE